MSAKALGRPTLECAKKWDTSIHTVGRLCRRRPSYRRFGAVRAPDWWHAEGVVVFDLPQATGCGREPPSQTRKWSPMSHSSTPVGRRSVLALGGSLAAMGLFGAACGGNTGRGSSSSSSAGGGSKGSTVTLQQWYHQYGEAGTQQAVEKYAAAYPDATVTVQWSPGDYDKQGRVGAAHRLRPRRLRVRQRPVDRHDPGRPGRRPGRRPRRRQGRLHPGPHRADDLRGQDVRRPAGHRHAAAGLPQEPARQGRRPAAADHRRAAGRREEADHRQGQGPVRRQRRRGRRARRPAAVVGRARLPHQGQHSSASTTPPPPSALGKLRALFTSGSLLLGAPTDWSDPSALTPGAHRDAVDRPVDLPRPEEEPRRRLRRAALARAERLRRSRRCRSAPTGRASAPRARTSTPPRRSSSGCGSTRPTTSSTSRQSYGFHIPARKSLAAKARQAQERAGRRRGPVRHRRTATRRPRCCGRPSAQRRSATR